MDGVWYGPRQKMYYDSWVKWWHYEHRALGCKVRRMGVPEGYPRDVIIVVNGLGFG